MIQKQRTPKLIWELKLPINSKLHSKVFISVCDECYAMIYEPIYKNIVNSVNTKYGI